MTDIAWVPQELAPYLADVLRSVGYRVRLHLVPAATITPALRQKLQLTVDGDWLPDYPSPSAYLPQFFGCGGGDSNGYVCNPDLDSRMRRASMLQVTDAGASEKLWSAIDRQLTDSAYWVPTVNVHPPEFVSRRVRNYEYSPVLGFLPDQVSLR